ncbi:MAG: YCF48-related protein [Candidatus Parcubacteria bacterium]|nr:YCF48-related protein [Candidatus Parcubacteria bacterium]
MGKFQKIIFIFCLAILAVSLSGCISVKDSSKTPKGYIGVFKSEDNAVTWKLKGSLLNTQGKVIPLVNVSVNRLILDPSDNNTVYLASEQGWYYSNDAGNSWMKSKFFENDNIADIAIDYQDKCTLYITVGANLSKSTDCGRTFTTIYNDSRAIKITDIETDRYAGNQNLVYFANSGGELRKSENFGGTWTLIRGSGNAIKQILLNAEDTRNIYLLIEKAGIAKSIDGGVTWSDTDKKTESINKDGAKLYKNFKNARLMVQDLSASNAFIYVSDYGLLRTIDGAQTWKPINLVTTVGGKNIYSLAVDPTNGNLIYYGTDSTVYKSADGGSTWSTQKAPNVGYVNFLLVDPKNTKNIYLGAKKIPEK